MKIEMKNAFHLIPCFVILFLPSVSFCEMTLRYITNHEGNITFNHNVETQQNAVYQIIHALQELTCTEDNSLPINITTGTNEISDEEMKRIVMTKDYQK